MKACSKGFNATYHEESPALSEITVMPGYAILEFGAPWCGHCETASGVVEAVLSKQALPHIKIYDGKGKRLGRAFKVKLWPTLILVKSGKEVARVIRPVTREEVQDLLSHCQPW